MYKPDDRPEYKFDRGSCVIASRKVSSNSVPLRRKKLKMSQSITTGICPLSTCISFVIFMIYMIYIISLESVWILLVIIQFLFLAQSPAAVACPADYTILPNVNLCVKFYDVTGSPRTYTTWQSVCQSDGGWLVKINNPTEQSALATWLGKPYKFIYILNKKEGYIKFSLKLRTLFFI